jgi:hypothetical protein
MFAQGAALLLAGGLADAFDSRRVVAGAAALVLVSLLGVRGTFPKGTMKA